MYGTTGELIKLMPLMQWAKTEGVKSQTWCTGQQLEELPDATETLRLSPPDRWLARGWKGKSLRTKRDVVLWLMRLTSHLLRHHREMRRTTRGAVRSLVIVHGDTMTTVIGAAIGRVLRADVAHVEAGLRSGTWKSPFPEELNRRATTRLARLHFAPGSEAVENLRQAKAKGRVVNTHYNTVLDSLTSARRSSTAEQPDEPYCLASLHREELLSNRSALTGVLKAVDHASQATRVVFIDHPVTVQAILNFELDGLLGQRVQRVPKLAYFDFIQLVKGSAFVVTDSGGLQEECAYLGHPCLVHRDVTERSIGIGASVVFSGGDLDILRDFLKDPESFRRAPLDDFASPTDLIVEDLIVNGYVERV